VQDARRRRQSRQCLTTQQRAVARRRGRLWPRRYVPKRPGGPRSHCEPIPTLPRDHTDDNRPALIAKAFAYSQSLAIVAPSSKQNSQATAIMKAGSSTRIWNDRRTQTKPKSSETFAFSSRSSMTLLGFASRIVAKELRKRQHSPHSRKRLYQRRCHTPRPRETSTNGATNYPCLLRSAARKSVGAVAIARIGRLLKHRMRLGERLSA
jgi:hypothetical protein